MHETAAGTVQALYRYPVKGLGPDRLERVILAEGETMPLDRAYAIENGPGPLDLANPKHLPKIHFVMLMRNEQLASVTPTFDESAHTLTLSIAGARLAQGDLRTDEGRAAIEAAVVALVGAGMRGPARVVASPGHSFSDVAAKCVHIVNLESVRALETAMGATIDPLRFRPNIVVAGWPAWSEFELIGRCIQAGDAILDCFKRTERCAATNVDPETGVRDLKIPSFLSRNFGHTDFGIYARVSQGGAVKAGDRIG